MTCFSEHLHAYCLDDMSAHRQRTHTVMHIRGYIARRQHISEREHTHSVMYDGGGSYCTRSTRHRTRCNHIANSCSMNLHAFHTMLDEALSSIAGAWATFEYVSNIWT